MPLTNSFPRPPGPNGPAIGDFILAYDGEAEVFGQVCDMSNSTWLFVLGATGEGDPTPRLAHLDQLVNVRVVEGDLRLEPLDGDNLGASITGRPTVHGTLRVHPDGEARFLMQDEGTGVSWFSLTAGNFAQPQRTTQVALYLCWQVVLFKAEGAAVKRIVLARHN